MREPHGHFKIFLLFIALNTLVHLPFMGYPPSGMHVWRQCNTLAMSRNFLLESMDITKPRIDRRNDGNGITGSHFPLYEWGLAAVWKLSGESETLARCYSLILFSSAMFAFYLLMQQTGSDKGISVMSSLLLLSVPQLYYDSINAMPDIAALPLALFSLVCLLKFTDRGKSVYLISGTVLAAAAGLIKFQFLIIPFSSVAFLSRINRRNIILPAAMLLCTLPVAMWYRYAIELTESSNLREFGLWIREIPGIEKWEILKGNALSDLPELLSGWPLFICLLWFAGKKARGFKMNRMLIFSLIWAIGFIGFYIIAIERMKYHSYYFIVLIPLIVFVTVKSIQDHKKAFAILLVLFLSNLTFAFARIIPGRWAGPGKGIPAEFTDPVKRKELKELLNGSRITVTGPDISGCIYFYFTSSRGYSFEYPSELLQDRGGRTYLDEMIGKGAMRLLIYDEPSSKELIEKIHPLKPLGRVGSFTVYDLRGCRVILDRD